MDNTTLITVIWSMVAAFGVSALTLLVWGIKVLVSAVWKNTIQLELLNQHITDLLKLPPVVAKMKEDLNVAHERIRTIYKNGGPE